MIVSAQTWNRRMRIAAAGPSWLYPLHLSNKYSKFTLVLYLMRLPTNPRSGSIETLEALL